MNKNKGGGQLAFGLITFLAVAVAFFLSFTAFAGSTAALALWTLCVVLSLASYFWMMRLVSQETDKKTHGEEHDGI